MRLQDDPRCQPGALLVFERSLYEVAYVKEQQQHSVSGTRVVLLLHVVDCRSPVDDPTLRWLGERQVKLAELVRAAPVVEDAIPA